MAPRQVAESAGARQFAPLIRQIDSRIASALLVAVRALLSPDVLRSEHDSALADYPDLPRPKSALTSYGACSREGMSDTSAGFKIGMCWN